MTTDENLTPDHFSNQIANYRYETLTFTPDQLDVDFTVNETNVSTLMESIITCKAVLEPIFVWRDKDGIYWIINGMHRVTASKRALATVPTLTIPAINILCDEETFWALRVIAAAPHASIKKERIDEWVRMAWKNSEVGKDADASLLSAAYGGYLRKGKFNNESIHQWFSDKAKLWGVAPQGLAYIVLGSFRTEQGRKIVQAELLETSARLNLTVQQHSMLIDAFPKGVGTKGKLHDAEHVNEWASQVLRNTTPDQTPIAPDEYFRQKYEAPKAQPRVSNKPAIEQIEEVGTVAHSESEEEVIYRWASWARASSDFTQYLNRLTQVDYEKLYAARPETKRKIDEMLNAADKVREKVSGISSEQSEFALIAENRQLKERIRQLEVINRERERSVRPVIIPATVMALPGE